MESSTNDGFGGFGRACIGLLIASVICAIFKIPLSRFDSRRNSMERLEELVQEQKYQNQLKMYAQAAHDQRRLEVVNISVRFMESLTDVRTNDVMIGMRFDTGELVVPENVDAAIERAVGALKKYNDALTSASNSYICLHKDFQELKMNLDAGKVNQAMAYATCFYHLFVEEAACVGQYLNILKSGKDRIRQGEFGPKFEDLGLLKEALAVSRQLDGVEREIFLCVEHLPGNENKQERFKYPRHVVEMSLRTANEHDIKSMFGIELGVKLEKENQQCNERNGFCIVGKDRYYYAFESGDAITLKVKKSFYGSDYAIARKSKLTNKIFGVEKRLDLNVDETHQLVGLLENKYQIVFEEPDDDDLCVWTYESLRYGKTLSVTRDKNSHVIIRLRDVAGAKEAEEENKKAKVLQEEESRKQNYDAL